MRREYPPEAVTEERRRKWDSLSKGKTIAFRPATLQCLRDCTRLKWAAKDRGTSICRVYGMFARAFMQSVDGIREQDPELLFGQNMILINQNNSFLYTPEYSRRLPEGISDISKGISSNTVYRLAIDSYILLKSLEMHHPFCFRDFLELGYNTFKNAVLRLKRKGKITPWGPRSNPRFYHIAPRYLAQIEGVLKV